MQRIESTSLLPAADTSVPSESFAARDMPSTAGTSSFSQSAVGDTTRELSQMLQSTSLTSLSQFLGDLDSSAGSMMDSEALPSFQKTPREPVQPLGDTTGLSFSQPANQIQTLIQKVDELKKSVFSQRTDQSFSSSGRTLPDGIKQYIDRKFDLLQENVHLKIHQSIKDAVREHLTERKLHEDVERITKGSGDSPTFDQTEHLWLKITELELKVDNLLERGVAKSAALEEDSTDGLATSELERKVNNLKMELDIIDAQVSAMAQSGSQVEDRIREEVEKKISKASRDLREDILQVNKENLQKTEKSINSKIETMQFTPVLGHSNTNGGVPVIDVELKKELRKLRKSIDEKLDAGVVEELMRHIATREELVQLADVVKASKPPVDVEKRLKFLESTQKQYLKLVNELRKTSTVMIKANLASFTQEFEKKQDDLRQQVKSTLEQFGSKVDYVPTRDKFDDARIKREDDERFKVLYSELSACKQAWQMSVRQPFYRCAQWVWNSGLLKFGSAIPWNLETSNTDSENFIWERDMPTIKIAEGGLYEISFAFFTKTKPSIQILVNGESVLSAINSPTYVVHHASGYVMSEGRMEPGVVTGISLVDFLALPFKSTLALHYHGGKKGQLGHGFLSLKKL